MNTSERVVVFIDYENMQRCAKDAFAVDRGHFWPWKLGKLLVDKRNARVDARPSHLAGVQVYRGLPSPRREPNAHAANEAQTASWHASTPEAGHLTIYRRPLRYPRDWPDRKTGRPQEKGIDVALAVDLVRMTYQGAFEVAIVCSHDTDLSPALDAADSVRTTRHHIEVASWDRRKRISYSRDPNLPWCHRLDAADFDLVRDPTNYPMRT